MPGSAATAAAAKSAATARTWARGPWPRREPGAALQRAARSVTPRTRLHPIRSTGDDTGPAHPRLATHSPAPLTRPANSDTLSPVPPFPGPRGPPPRSYRGSQNRDQQRGQLRKVDGGRTVTRMRACAQADPTRVPDVVVMETPRPRAPGAGCSHSARSLLAQERSGGHGSRAAGRPPRPPHSGRTLRARPAPAVIKC